MIRFAVAGLLAVLGVSPSFADPEAGVQQVQFRGSPGGGCPDGYDFNFDNGRCYPNNYHAPGTYRRPPDYGRQRNYYGTGAYGSCPDGYDFNYSNGRCYPNARHAPGVYAR